MLALRTIEGGKDLTYLFRISAIDPAFVARLRFAFHVHFDFWRWGFAPACQFSIRRRGVDQAAALPRLKCRLAWVHEIVQMIPRADLSYPDLSRLEKA